MGHFISDDRLKSLGHQLLCALFAAYDFPVLYREKFPHHDPDPLDDFRALKDSKIKLLKPSDGRKPYPLSPEEQEQLFAELPEHLRRMALFKVNTGCRDAEVCGLRWGVGGRSI